MNNYEVLYVIDGTISDEAIQEQVQKFSDLVTNNGGEIVDINEWGKRRLAYQINYKSEGYYVLMNFKSDPDFPVELERIFGITESIVRYMVERKPDGYVPPKKAARAKFEKPKEEVKPEIKTTPATDETIVEKAPVVPEAIVKETANEAIVEETVAEEKKVEIKVPAKKTPAKSKAKPAEDPTE
ncbi:MAG: 30S ribosomal protein S6 [Clostridiales bacterium]|nr:30S ribosomal protein S6 [Clostridiales bacterium]